MSRTLQPKVSTAEDLWTKIEAVATFESNEDNSDTTTVIVGDAGSGKSTLIQGFLKPSVLKEPKATFALDYNFARKKAASGQSASKSIAHIWELGGEISEPKLLEIPFTARTLSFTTVAICCDMSKPQNVLASLKKWITLVRDVIKKRLLELQGQNSGLVTQLREAAAAQYSENTADAARTKPCEIPLYIILNKYDVFKSLSLSDRRSYLQLVRFIAHFHGASIITTSSAESSLKENFRSFMNVSCFRGAAKIGCESAVDKPVLISAGKDDFASILTSSLNTKQDSNDGSSKSKLLYSEADVSNFLTPTGLTRDCWTRFGDHIAVCFGPPEDSVVNSNNNNDEEKEAENEFPETEVDEMRNQRDTALQRYILESERKEAMLAKMSLSSASKGSSASETTGGGGSGENAARSSEAPQKKKSTRK